MVISPISNASAATAASAQQALSALPKGGGARPQQGAEVELRQQAVSDFHAPGNFESVKKAAEQINQVAQKLGRDLQFSVDPDTHAQVVKVVDTQTREVIRQMPTQEMLAIAKALDKLQGLLLKDKV